jgi:hypothetical protein
MNFIGRKHSFYPIIVHGNGYCQPYNEQLDYADFFNIVDSPRYQAIQHIFQNKTLPSVPTERIVYTSL